VLIEARGLTKCYGRFLAVDRLQFAVQRGEIVALLGTNGAGKSTTMRMLSCFLLPTDGTALVGGHDVALEPMEARRHIGYMPENNPLYGEMRVGEYLKYRAELKCVPRRLRVRRIEQCMERCGMQEVGRQVIRTLSKGYRQRVGLADALLGNPDVLILDEPTIGLDPNQIRQTRQTIRELGLTHTILLSTHILQEVEAVCQRVVIINRGRIVLDDTLGALGGAGAVIVELKGDAGTMRTALLALDGVCGVSVRAAGEWMQFTVEAGPRADVRADIAALAAARGWPLRELRGTPARLEEVFHRITVQQEERPLEQPSGQL